MGYDIRVTTSLSADGSAPAPPAPAALTQPQVSAPQPQPQPQPQPAGSGAGTPGGRRRLSGGAVGAQTPVGVVKTRESWAAHVGGGGSGRNAMWQHLRRGQARRDLLQDPAVPHIPTVTRIQVGRPGARSWHGRMGQHLHTTAHRTAAQTPSHILLPRNGLPDGKCVLARPSMHTDSTSHVDRAVPLSAALFTPSPHRST